MGNLTLDDLLRFGRKTDLREFYLPIDKNVPEFDDEWLKKIVMGEGTEAERLAAIKAHPYIRAGHIVCADLDKIGLQMLFYADPNGKAIKDFRELVFHYGPVMRTTTSRLNQLKDWSVTDLAQVIQFSNHDGYGHDDIKPELAEITQIGSFDIEHFGSGFHGGNSNQITAKKKFEFEGTKACLTYKIVLDPEDGEIGSFKISFDAYSGEAKVPDLKVDIDIKRMNGVYIPSADVSVKSRQAARYRTNWELANYHFDSEGQFESISVPGSNFTYHRHEIKDMEKFYSRLLGIVWQDGKYYVMLTEEHEGANIAALMTPEGGEHRALQAIKGGELIEGKDYEVFPVVGCASAPGLQDDLLRIQSYRNFVQEFKGIRLFKNAHVESVGIDYVEAIQVLASLQSKPAHEVMLLTN